MNFIWMTSVGGASGPPVEMFSWVLRYTTLSLRREIGIRFTFGNHHHIANVRSGRGR